ncbi:glycerophosphodiester phosphodiesterase [Streptomyces sp. NPDC093594]|uniref:glycerophosphodiester phosphodiesterase n=1 Tax=Streptomyces sp. NPDC093594 TaxID=3155305 RepID=UPI00345050A2
MTWRVFENCPALIGHRGMGAGVVAGHRENTVSSFRAAARAGAAWVELDVQRTRDDALMVVHDPVLPDGRYLAELTSDDAARHGLVRLEDLLEQLPPGLGVAVEIKSGLHDAARPADATTAALLARRYAHGLSDRPVLALSFDPAALQHLRQSAPDLPLGLLTWKTFPIQHAVAAAAHLDVQVLALHTSSLAPPTSGGVAPLAENVFDIVHAARRQVLVWCPESTGRTRDFAAAGVDAVIVDDIPRHARAKSVEADVEPTQGSEVTTA